MGKYKSNIVGDLSTAAGPSIGVATSKGLIDPKNKPPRSHAPTNTGVDRRQEWLLFDELESNATAYRENRPGEFKDVEVWLPSSVDGHLQRLRSRYISLNGGMGRSPFMLALIYRGMQLMRSEPFFIDYLTLRAQVTSVEYSDIALEYVDMAYFLLSNFKLPRVHKGGVSTIRRQVRMPNSIFTDWSDMRDKFNVMTERGGTSNLFVLLLLCALSDQVDIQHDRDRRVWQSDVAAIMRYISIVNTLTQVTTDLTRDPTFDVSRTDLCLDLVINDYMAN